MQAPPLLWSMAGTLPPPRRLGVAGMSSRPQQRPRVGSMTSLQAHLPTLLQIRPGQASLALTSAPSLEVDCLLPGAHISTHSHQVGAWMRLHLAA